MKQISTPPLLKMRTLVSDDGRWARFFLLFKTGQNTAFSIPFNKIGLLLKVVKTVIKTMADRIAARGAFGTEEVAEGLSEPIRLAWPEARPEWRTRPAGMGALPALLGNLG
jgi:hypothetical protein